MTLTTVSAQNNNNQFFLLNYDVLCRVLSELPRPQDIFSVLVTDKFLSAFVTTSVPLWQNILPSHFPFYTPISNDPKGEYQCAKIREENMSKLRHVTAGPPFPFWNGSFTAQNSKFVVCFDGNRLTVKDLKSGQVHCRESARGPYKLAVQGNHLCCSDYTKDHEHVIFVWDLNDQEKKPKHILRGHQNLINSLTIQENEIVSSSVDGVRIWDSETGEELKVWEEDGVLAHAVQGNEHFIAQDNIIKVYDKKSGKELYTLNGEHPIDKLIIQGTTLVSIEKKAPDQTYNCKVWDLKSRKVLFILRDISDTGFSPRVAIIDNVLFIANTDKEAQEIKAWNIKTGKQLPPLPFYPRVDPYRDIQAHEGKLYFGQLGQFTVYDFNLAPLGRQVLEENLAQLENMATLENNSAKFMDLAKALHPSFQERLTQAFQLKEPISLVQTEVIVELLFGCIRSGDQKGISDLLMKLTLLNAHEDLYKHLWEACGSPTLPEQMGRSPLEKWGYCAFLDGGIEGYSATVDQKEEALIMFKSQLLKKTYKQ